MNIKLDYAAIGKLETAMKVAATMAIEALKTEVVTAQVMPFDYGDMQNAQTFTDVSRDGESITARVITGSPQARRLYYHPEYNFQTVNNPNAGGEWLKPWIEGERKGFLQDRYSEFFKEKAGL